MCCNFLCITREFSHYNAKYVHMCQQKQEEKERKGKKRKEKERKGKKRKRKKKERKSIKEK